jgi:hypothetical protein
MNTCLMTVSNLLALGVGLIAAIIIVAVGLGFAASIKALIEYLRK